MYFYGTLLTLLNISVLKEMSYTTNQWKVYTTAAQI